MITGFFKFIQSIVCAFEPNAENDFAEILAFLAIISDKIGFTI